MCVSTVEYACRWTLLGLARRHSSLGRVQLVLSLSLSALRWLCSTSRTLRLCVQLGGAAVCSGSTVDRSTYRSVQTMEACA